ncbi:MAG: hypothetical protein ACREF9_20220 [Opitutaceae bacterium]
MLIRSCLRTRRSFRGLASFKTPGLGCVAAALTGALHAQSPGVPTIADQRWSSVSTLGNAAAATLPLSGPRTPEQIRATEKERALRFRAVAKAAKEFHVPFAVHPKTGYARKLEALASLEGITADDPANRSEALKIAGDFRNDKRNAAADRFEVASAMERGELSRKLGGRSWYGNAIEAEIMGDRLRKEFGERPEVYGFYLNIAENGSCFNSGDVATKILQLNPSAGIRASAQRVLDRWNMIGRPLDLPLRKADGAATSLGAMAGRRTVVVVYSSERDPAGPPGLGDFRKLPPAAVNWVYIALGAAPGQGTQLNAIVPGTLCVETLGLKSAVARQLKVSRLPAVYVLNEKKALFGFGRIDELPWLLAKSNPALHDHAAP